MEPLIVTIDGEEVVLFKLQLGEDNQLHVEYATKTSQDWTPEHREDFEERLLKFLNHVLGEAKKSIILNGG
jgi:hypothetical protein